MPPSANKKKKQLQRQASPFFAPSTPKVITSSPGGSTKITTKAPVKEHKSSVVGTAANLINAIVGAGIVGIPYALKEAGMCAGVGLVLLCALLTDKSLRLLVETAKHVDVPSYETLAEACFGTAGFLFVSINMFIMAYGAMVSYLMIVKDTLPLLMGVSDEPTKRAILFVVSLVCMVPLSSQRDMADLAKTSRLSVLFDSIMVCIVSYVSPWQTMVKEVGFMNILKGSIVRPDTIFVGLGVLSFAFVCQHSAFIIAGSLENPTKVRWSRSVRYALSVCVTLATVCGLSGYLGFLESTEGNILNNLDDSVGSNIARGLLGVTMLFVYPMESFVSRHVCVVLLFRGRRAHEGEDSAVLNRRDRRISLTICLYILALVPALCFRDLGTVLASTGAVGGSCLSYIGPGVAYLGVHGDEFLMLARSFFGSRVDGSSSDEDVEMSSDMVALTRDEDGGREEEDLDKDQIVPIETTTTTTNTTTTSDAWYVVTYKTLLWYGMLMPLWCAIATVGGTKVQEHQQEMALKSPHPIRIGKVQQKRILQMAARRLEEGAKPIVRSDSLHMIGNRTVLPPAASSYQNLIPIDAPEPKLMPQSSALESPQNEAQEDDPQADPPQVLDFVIAVGYMVFGVMALAAGLVSIYASS